MALIKYDKGSCLKWFYKILAKKTAHILFFFTFEPLNEGK